MVLGLDERSMVTFREIMDVDSLCTYLDESGMQHDSFFHYTSLENAKKIVDGKCFKLGDISRFNDLSEATLVEKLENKYYALCLSTPVDKNDNVTMWYLYTKGRGVALEFKRTSICKLMTDSKVYLDLDGQMEQLNEIDYELSIKDVLYFREFYSGDRIELRNKNASNYHFSKTNINGEFQKKYGLFMKDIIWNAENETRILCKLGKEKSEWIKKSCAKSNIFVEVPKIENLFVCRKGPECDYQEDAYKGIEFIEAYATGRVRTPFWQS